jgi:CubicO group peptidase (beta-lactamase class C family)
MVTIQTPESEEDGYGIGLSISKRPEGFSIVGHGGSVAGYTAYMAVSPESGIGVVLLRNYQRGETNLGRAARDLVAELTLAGR